MTKIAKEVRLDRLTTPQRPSDATVAWEQARKDLNNGRHAQAFSRYQSLVRQLPCVAQLWTEMGVAAARDLEFVTARQAFQRAVELAPADPSLLLFIAWQLFHLRQLDEAFACLKQAVAVDPASANLRLTLASWLERSRRLDEAQECVETCLKHHPNDGPALHARAFLLHRKGRNGDAEAALRTLLASDPLLPLQTQIHAYHLLGIVLDELGQYTEALSSLGKAKTLRRQMTNTVACEQAYNRVGEMRRALLAELRPETLKHWREEAAASPCAHRLALVAGAPRSGTTLLQQILAAHPDNLVFDEPESFSKEVVQVLQPPPPAPSLTLKALRYLGASQRNQLTSRYFKSLLRETDGNPDGKLLLDKNPAITAWLPVWLRLFPQSKVIITLRDPRDVILSCYFQDVPEDWTIFTFFNLELTARFYASCMDAWLRLRELGGFEWLETRYENLVGDLEGEGKRMTNFLGLEWHQDQAAYHKTTAGKFVFSPSYNAVGQPIYNRAVGRWKHYAEAFAPLEARLEPFLRAFGYS